MITLSISLIKDALVESDVIDAQIIDNQLISAQEAPYIVNVKDLGVTLIFDPTFNANELKGNGPTIGYSFC